MHTTKRFIPVVSVSMSVSVILKKHAETVARTTIIVCADVSDIMDIPKATFLNVTSAVKLHALVIVSVVRSVSVNKFK